MWPVSALIVLPPALASAMVIVNFLLSWFRVKRGHAVPFKWIYSAATVLIGTQVAILVLSAGMCDYPGLPDGSGLAGVVGLGVIVLAVTLRWVINVALVMAALVLANPTAGARDRMANFNEHLLEAGAIAFGLIVAVILVITPLVMPGVVITMVALR